MLVLFQFLKKISFFFQLYLMLLLSFLRSEDWKFIFHPSWRDFFHCAPLYECCRIRQWKITLSHSILILQLVPLVNNIFRAIGLMGHKGFKLYFCMILILLLISFTRSLRLCSLLIYLDQEIPFWCRAVVSCYAMQNPFIYCLFTFASLLNI